MLFGVGTGCANIRATGAVVASGESKAQMTEETKATTNFGADVFGEEAINLSVSDAPNTAASVCVFASRRVGFAECGNPDHDTADCADPRPYGVGRAHWNRLHGNGEQPHA